VRDYEGFPLQGGRVDALHGRTVAAMVYGRRKHVVDLFVWPGAAGEKSASFGSKRGYQWVSWRHDGMEMRLVSDVAMTDLRELQELMVR
jgi:anti-sigma factor RsiW